MNKSLIFQDYSIPFSKKVLYKNVMTHLLVGNFYYDYNSYDKCMQIKNVKRCVTILFRGDLFWIELKIFEIKKIFGNAYECKLFAHDLNMVDNYFNAIKKGKSTWFAYDPKDIGKLKINRKDKLISKSVIDIFYKFREHTTYKIDKNYITPFDIINCLKIKNKV